ncbi:MAG: acyl-CoA reductase [Cyclobacteriaceae bacterium]
MQLSERIFAFLQLGRRLRSITDQEKLSLFKRAQAANGWFTFDNLNFSLQHISDNLTEEALSSWLEPYNLSNIQPRKVGVVMAGNIPLVGFHDFISVLISGHILKAKLSSQDEVLFRYIANLLIEEEPAFANRLMFADQLKDIEAVIATGSDNSARYFEFYFGKYPHIIRKNRTSVAILTGTETESDYQKLGEDIFRYFGLGCRNVAKLFVPDSFVPASFIDQLKSWQGVVENHKYANNYDYNRSIYLLKQVPFWEGGYFLMLENSDLFSPLAVVYFEKYTHIEQVKETIARQQDKIQCVVGKADYPGIIYFGEAQRPGWSDYADNIDTIQFLQAL